MDCKTARLLLEFARPMELAGNDADALQQHLARCPECAALAQSEQQFDEQMGPAMRNVPVPAGLRARLLDRLARERRRGRRRWLARGAAVAAALLLAASAGWLGLRPQPRRIDVEQLCWEEIARQSASPEQQVEPWYRERGHAVSLALFDTSRLRWYGLGEFQGVIVPHLLFQRDRDLARVYVLDARHFDRTHLLQQPPAGSGGLEVKVLPDPGNEQVVYLVIFSGGPEEWFRLRRPSA